MDDCLYIYIIYTHSDASAVDLLNLSFLFHFNIVRFYKSVIDVVVSSK